MKRKFIDEFAINEEKTLHEDIKDYNAFPDKDLLEKLRNEITFALKNNVVIFNKPTSTQDSQIILNDEKINKNENNNELNHKTSNKPFDKFNFS